MYHCAYKIQDIVPNFPIFIFKPISAGKWAWLPSGRLKVWGLKNKTKIWSTGFTFKVKCQVLILLLNRGGKTFR